MTRDIRCAICHKVLVENSDDINLTAYVICAHCLPKLVKLSSKELRELAYPGGENGTKPTHITL